MFVYLDIILVGLGLLYALINDYRNFGSGYKEFLRQKAKRFDLSSDEYKFRRMHMKLKRRLSSEGE